MNLSNTTVRVLYTINTSPQYILAKSPEKIPLVSADDTLQKDGMPMYGRAPLKTCAMAICRSRYVAHVVTLNFGALILLSSPEITPDPSRDYSVYVLDPLEDFMSKERRGQSSSSSGGVAVGMGLLSQVLSPFTSESSTVIGTVIGCGNGEYALEVVLSLKQVILIFVLAYSKIYT